MPQIPEYTASQPGIAAPETGVEAFAQAGRRIGTFYHQEGQELGGAIRSAGEAAQKYLDHQEISHGAVAYAGLFNKFTQDWNDTAKGADPNDPLVATRWRAKVEPELEDFVNSFHTEAGQKWAESRVDAMRMHLFEKTTADMATLAGNAVTVNTQKVTDTYANVVSTDPSALPAAMKHYDDSIPAMVDAAPNLTADKASQIKEELRFRGMQQIVKAGIQSAIEKNPDAGMAMAQDPRFAPYINASEIKQFDTYARAMTRMAQVQERQAQLLQKQVAEQQVHTSANKIFTDSVKVGDDGTVTIDPKFYKDMADIVRNHPDAPDAVSVAKTNIDWAQAQSREKREIINDDPQVKAQLLDRIFDPDHPATKQDILKAEVAASNGGRGLSTRTGTLLRQMIDERVKGPEGERLAADRKDFFDHYAGTIDAGFGSTKYGNVHTALGNEQIFKAKAEAVRQELELIRKGQDPHSLYDPESPNYFGNRIGKYRATMQDISNYEAAHNKEPANLGDQKITGIEKIDHPPGQKTFVAPANWQFNPRRQQYRDPSGQLYDVSGKPVEGK